MQLQRLLRRLLQQRTRVRAQDRKQEILASKLKLLQPAKAHIHRRKKKPVHVGGVSGVCTAANAG